MSKSNTEIKEAINNFINETDLEFHDISGKKYIEYHFSNGSQITIKNPLYLAILETGENLICDVDLVCYKIRPKIGWWKKWSVKKDAPHFTNVDIISIKKTEPELIKS